MGDESSNRLLASIFILFASAYFVGAEYALIGCRRSRMEALARRGNRLAKRVVLALNNTNRHLAGAQACITMVGIGAGAITEPFITSMLQGLFATAPERSVTVSVASLLIVTFFMVVTGELVPKYVVLQRTDKLALILVPPLTILIIPLFPLIWLMDQAGAGILRLFGIRMDQERSEAIPREEMLLLIKAQSAEGMLEDVHAKMLSRAFQLDKLDAKDIMIHRMDIRWLDIDTPRAKLVGALADIPNNRIPVCRGDVDEVAGILYLHDVIRHWDDPQFQLEGILRPVVAVPENVTLDRIVERMRETQCQMLIVVDEYGGTSGLVTIEDVVEEIFGELEDRIEHERPTIEVHPGGRVSARAEVRFDELVARLGVDPADEPSTDTLAQLFVDSLQRVPKLGDTIQTWLGMMRIENMARRRITRVSLQLSRETQEAIDQSRRPDA